jgi:putative intracellular protease/amidase
VLGGNLLKGRRYVCSGDLWQDVKNGEYVDAPVVEDGNLISGKGFGHVFDFAFTVRHVCWARSAGTRTRRSYLLPLVVPR